MSERDGLYKRGRIWWVRVDPITRERESTGCKSKPAAEAWYAERERLAANPSYAAAHEALIVEWTETLRNLKKAEKAHGTWDMYVTKTGHIDRVFVDEFKLTRMVDVDPGSVDRYIAFRRKEGGKDHTIDKELTAIRQMCKIAKRAGKWSGDIDVLVPEEFSSKYEPRETVLTFEQVRTLFRAMPLDKVVAVALASLGCRRAEVQRILPEHTDLATWTIRIPGTKTKRSARHIPIVLPSGRLFLQLVAESGELPVSWPSMSSGLPKYAKAAGLPHTTPNDLRRSFATWNIEGGVSRENVAKLLGHTSTAMVFRVYGREDAARFGETIRAQLPAAPEAQSGSVGTMTSQWGECFGGPGSGFSIISGVSDGDRTRDNRSHNPKQGSTKQADPTSFAWLTCHRIPRRTLVSPVVCTTTSHQKEARDAVHARLAAVGFRVQSLAWFRRGAAA